MPWPVHPNGLLGAQGDQDTYRIERSLRFNSADSAYLNRTPASAGNRKTWTWSGWVKRASLGSIQQLFSATVGSPTTDSNLTGLSFSAGDTLTIGGGLTTFLETSQVFRDISAWYHLVCSVDTTSATANNRIRFYVNGSEITSFSGRSNPTLNLDTAINSTVQHNVGSAQPWTTRYFDGYLTEINFIDGQALTPSSFGETDAITGRWKAKAYSGTYGTNGFYLKFADNSGTTATTLGKDTSGNGNNWTPNNFSVTAGAGNDSLVDSPTNYGTDTGVGGEVRGNYCTWNPLVPGDSATNGNLDVTNDTARGNQELMKYNSYWEVTSTGGTCLAGIISTAATSTVTVGSAKTFGFKLSTAGVFEYANVTDGSSFTSQATATTPPLAYASTGASITASLNAGQRPFVAAAPTGFKALCTTNLPQPTIQKPSKYMDVVTWTGNGSASQDITGLSFSPDLVWLKSRTDGYDHRLKDSTRGNFVLFSNLTNAQVAYSLDFLSNGIRPTLGYNDNISSKQYVAWAWDRAAIDGLDIVSYSGNSSTQNVSHGLGVAPSMIIVKTYSPSVDAGEGNWCVYHRSLGSNKFVYLDLTNAAVTSTTIWNNTAPTASVFSLGNDNNVNKTGKTQIAYCFAEVEGFSKFGSYTGNGSADGPFVWCGFRPRWILVKRTDGSVGWILFDTARNTFNVANSQINPDSSAAEDSSYSWYDILSNGFKSRTNLLGNNASGGTYIFAAFAESPFKYARAR